MGSLCNADGSKIMTEDDGYETIVPDLSASEQAIAQHEGGQMCGSCGYTADPDCEICSPRTFQHEGGQGEPVALLQEHPSGDRDLVFYRNGSGHLTAADKAAGWTETPLYAHPPATLPAALAEDEVEASAKQIAKLTMKDLRIDRDTGMLYVAAVEAAKRTIAHLSPRITQQDSDWFAGDVDAEGNELVTVRKDQITQQAEEVERLRHDLEECGARHWTRVRNDNARLREALGVIASNPNYPSVVLHGIAFRALNEQPGGEEV